LPICREYTHRVAISNRRLVAFDEAGITFRYKDYRRDGADRQRTMTLSTDEFIRRFLLHVLPKGFHRIRHYGLLASTGRKTNVARARDLLAVPAPAEVEDTASPPDPRPPMPLLRRSHGHHRDLSAYGSAACATVTASLYRDGGVVIRHDAPQPAAEAMELRPLGGHAPASIATATPALVTASSRGLPSPHHVNATLANRPFRQATPVVGNSKLPPTHTAASKSSNPHNVAPVPRGLQMPHRGPTPSPALDPPAPPEKTGPPR
jgi:hypothetical protein